MGSWLEEGLAKPARRVWDIRSLFLRAEGALGLGVQGLGFRV